MSQSYWDKIKPWDCAPCGKKRISANLNACPQCGEPREGSTAEPGSKKVSFAERIKPWTCNTCGMNPISANNDACPKCHTARPGTVAAKTQDLIGQTTVTYTGQKEMEQGIAIMAKAGWRVKDTSAYQPGSGVGRTLALGLVGALVFKPGTKFIVTFERVKAEE